MGHHHSVPRPLAHDGLSVILAYGNRSGFRPATGQILGRRGKNWVRCHDGFAVSVVAGPGMYCRPRPDMFDGPFDDGLDGAPPDAPSFYGGAFARVPATYRGPLP